MEKMCIRDRVQASDSEDPVSEAITRGLGGKKNISDVDCCATRLRCTIHDASRVNDSKMCIRDREKLHTFLIGLIWNI